MNKKGFTIVELLVSLIITMAVLVTLYEIIIVLKDTFQSASLKTEILNKESIIIDKIYSDFNNNSVSTVVQCGDYCLDFVMIDSTTKRLSVDKENLTIGYGDYTIKLQNTFSIGNIYFSNDSVNSQLNNNSVLSIKIPIYSKVITDEDLGIKMAFSYNSNNILVGSIYIADNTDECAKNEFCKSSRYNIGQAVKLAGYNWHIIDNDESTITLLLDTSELSNRSHVTETMNSYSWSTSYIKTYLNDTFYNMLKNNGLNSDYLETSKIGICNDETGSGGNPGKLENELETCNTNYIYSNVRLLSSIEFENLKNYLNSNDINHDFLYSASTGKWALINGDSTENKIMQVEENGNISKDDYNALLNVRAVVKIRKK